ncbi:GntR family transcriptional regulator [Nonomuraea wenchangensis]
MRIRAGEYPPRTVLSEVRLQSYFGVGRETIRKAFVILRDRGLIITKPGRGSVVLRRDGDASAG